MKDYPKLLPHQLWTITEQASQDTFSIGDFCLKKTEYAPEAYDSILAQAKDYKLVAESFIERGDVMDGRTPDDVDSKEIKLTAACIVVQNNAFVGVWMLCLHKEKIKYVEHENICAGILFADGTSAGITYDEYIRNPGHWCMTTEYFLEKR